jgi:H+/gluconate symporter-like permease
MRESPVSGGVRLGPVEHDLASNAGVRPLPGRLVKRTPQLSDRGGDILTGALVASASALISGAAYMVGWVWSQKYGERKKIEEEELSEDETQEASEDEGEEEDKASQMEKRGIRVHARHWTPETLTPTHWRE